MRARVSHPETPSTRDPHRCGCVAFKRFAKMSPLVVRARVGSLWCQKCGRLLCEAHRNQHSCEMEMEELERRRRVDVDAIREGIKRQEEEKEQRAADADALKRAEAGAKAARYRMWKDRRRHVVWCPASFLTSEHRGRVLCSSRAIAGGHLVERREHGPALERPGRSGPQKGSIVRHIYVAHCVEIKYLRRVELPRRPPRHRRDA